MALSHRRRARSRASKPEQAQGSSPRAEAAGASEEEARKTGSKAAAKVPQAHRAESDAGGLSSQATSLAATTAPIPGVGDAARDAQDHATEQQAAASEAESTLKGLENLSEGTAEDLASIAAAMEALAEDAEDEDEEEQQGDDHASETDANGLTQEQRDAWFGHYSNI